MAEKAEEEVNAIILTVLQEVLDLPEAMEKQIHNPKVYH